MAPDIISMGDSFPRTRVGGLVGMIQVHYICCTLYFYYYYIRASLVAQLVKESTCNAGDLGSISGLGGSPGEGKGYPLQYILA